MVEKFLDPGMHVALKNRISESLGTLKGTKKILLPARSWQTARLSFVTYMLYNKTTMESNSTMPKHCLDSAHCIIDYHQPSKVRS